MKFKAGVTPAICPPLWHHSHQATWLGQPVFMTAWCFEINWCLMSLLHTLTKNLLTSPCMPVSQRPSVLHGPQCWNRQHKYHVWVAITRLELCWCEQYVGKGAWQSGSFIRLSVQIALSFTHMHTLTSKKCVSSTWTTFCLLQVRLPLD